MRLLLAEDEQSLSKSLTVSMEENIVYEGNLRQYQGAGIPKFSSNVVGNEHTGKSKFTDKSLDSLKMRRVHLENDKIIILKILLNDHVFQIRENWS